LENVKSVAAAIEFGTSKIVTVVGEGSGDGPAQLLGFYLSEERERIARAQLEEAK
jgi:cell division ATPase FtsA